MSLESDLESVTQLRQALRDAKPRAEARARQAVARELASVEGALNQACADAYANGASYSAIGRALGTKDFGTVKLRVASAPGKGTNGTTGEGFEFNVWHDENGVDYLIFNGAEIPFVQYEDTGNVDFDGELDEEQRTLAMKFLKSMGKIS